MNRTNNYLKTKRRLNKKGEIVVPEKFFFFDDRDPDSRHNAWRLAINAAGETKNISIFRGSEVRMRFDRIIQYVDQKLRPISPDVQIVGQ